MGTIVVRKITDFWELAICTFLVNALICRYPTLPANIIFYEMIMHTRLIVYNPIFMACDEARVSEADADVPEVDEQTEILSFGRMPPLDCMGRI